jgi:D-sedoheptulose 7-phosphate isomerase
MREESVKVAETYISQLQKSLVNFPISRVLELATLIQELDSENTVYVIGNGGSATTASHMATDLGVGSIRRRNPIRCISLTDNVAVITATSNDLNFSQIFAQQLKLLGRAGDLLICFSASGNSENVLNACAEAKSQGILTIGITGFDGGRLKQICDYSIHLQTDLDAYGITEDLHSTVSHMLTEIIRTA